LYCADTRVTGNKIHTNEKLINASNVTKLHPKSELCSLLNKKHIKICKFYLSFSSESSICHCLVQERKIIALLYRVSQEKCARLRESVPYVKVYRYDPKLLYTKLNGYGDNGQRSLKL
jgi:hypothetical protein